MRKTMHDYLSSGSLKAIDAETWSKNKFLMHPKIIYSDTDDFTIVGKTFLTGALLEIERRFFGNTEDITFAERGKNYDVSLSDGEKEIVLLDKNTYCNKSVFSSASDQREAQDVLKSHHEKCHAQCESHERESLITSQLHQEDGTETEKDECNDSHMNDDDDNRLSF